MQCHVHLHCHSITTPFLPCCPLVEHLAPICHTVDVSGCNANGSYIVAIKLNTVDPNNQLQWLDKVLNTQGVTLDNDTTQSLKLRWSKDVFNSITGTFSTDALDTLQQQPEVAWVEEGLSPTVFHLSVKLE